MALDTAFKIRLIIIKRCLTLMLFLFLHFQVKCFFAINSGIILVHPLDELNLFILLEALYLCILISANQ